MKIVLFDIDGTLLRAGPAPEQAFCHAFAELFGKLTVWGTVDPSGRTDPWIIREVCLKALGRDLSPPEFDRLCDIYVTRYQEIVETADGFEVLPGILKLCEHLSSRDDIALGIQTGNLERSGRLKLRKAGVNQHFSFGGFGSDHLECPEIVKVGIQRACQHHGVSSAQANVFVIGDTVHDITAGKAAGAITIAVATGKSDAATLQAAAPDYIFENLGQAEQVLALLK